MFVVSKIFWALAQPGNALLLLLIVGLVLAGAGLFRSGLALASVAAGGLLAIAVLPVGLWLLEPLENRFPRPDPLPARVDGIIVVGGLIDPVLGEARGVPAINGAVERMVDFAVLAQRYPEATLVFSGGSGSVLYQTLKEADAARAMADQMGVPVDRVIWETASRNTHENAVLSKALVRPAPDGTWLLVTSAWHMPRAVGAFRGAGWPVTAWPTDYLSPGDGKWRPDFDLSANLALVETAVHEWVGLLAYRLLGRSEAVFPGPRPGTAAGAPGEGGSGPIAQR